MKFGLFTLAFAAAEDTTAAPLMKAPRRFNDFKKMFSEFFTHEELTKVYGYGCYCLNLGDTPLSGNSNYGGVPVDETDRMCFDWTKCNRCAKIDFKDQDCSAETTKYKFGVDGDEIICKDPEGSCGNSLCKCDREAVTNLKTLIPTLNDSFLAHKGFNTEQECKKKGVDRNTRDSDRSCCGIYPKRSPFNMNLKQCCDDKIRDMNTC